jgi:hypothetical protein
LEPSAGRKECNKLDYSPATQGVPKKSIGPSKRYISSLTPPSRFPRHPHPGPLPKGEGESSQQFFNYAAAGLGELFVAAFVEVGEFIVVKAQQMQDRAVDVFHVVDGVDGLAA